MCASRPLIRLVLSAILSLLLWWVWQDASESVVREVVVAVAAVSGERVPDARGGEVALVVDAVQAGRERRSRSYGTPLVPWHVNVIGVPIFLMTFGRATLRQRLLMSAVGVALVLLFDGLSVFAYLWLGACRLRGAPLVSAPVDAQVAYGIAVYWVKILPLAVCAAVYLVVRRWTTSSAQSRN